MQIYVAGKFEDKDLVRGVYRRIEDLGHTVAYDWTTHKPIKPYNKNPEMARHYSQNEQDAVATCDAFIAILDEKGTTLLLEIGAAIMAAKLNGKPSVFVVGPLNASSPWFFNSLVRRYDTIDEVFAVLANE